MKEKEKAHEGLRLLREAILEYIRKHPDGIRPDDIRDQLDLYSPDPDGKWKHTLTWGIENLLARDGLILRTNENGPRTRVRLFAK